MLLVNGVHSADKIGSLLSQMFFLKSHEEISGQ